MRKKKNEKKNREKKIKIKKKKSPFSYLDEEDDDAVEHVPPQVHRLGDADEEVEHERQAVERHGGDPSPVLLRLALVVLEVVPLGDLRRQHGVGGNRGEHRPDVLAELDVGVVRVGDVLLLIFFFCFESFFLMS